jgi:arginine/lysine/ornithine decarboxylase
MEAVVEAVDWCILHEILADFFREHRREVSNMILNELTNADAIEAVREETRESAREAFREEVREAFRVAREAVWQQVLDLIDQGLTGEQLKQAIEREYLPIVPKLSSRRTDVE